MTDPEQACQGDHGAHRRQAPEAVVRAEKGLGEIPNDAIMWTHQAAKGKEYHVADLQLTLSIASIEPLEKEASQVLGEYAYEKTSLYRMKLATA
ncbi:hypothetical protein VSDG_05290 [Cytospora chrysosperma]|uniref:Uncharacterized protein n=1 Tax=Cytospora chrysosperma TaxID=252740 RepID=A0A423VX50_CYTCH|nr:hypothetical protein VSDG_05290 [Valsa sordida]